MYRFLRNTHLVLGLFCCFFLLMFAVSAVQMSHPSWFSSRPAVSDTRLALAPQMTDARTVARELMSRQKLRGELTNIRATADTLEFWIARPGTVCQIEYATATGETKVRENRAGVMGMLNRIHQIAGLWHEYTMINVWTVFLGIVSISLFIIGGTGIYMWFKIHKERTIGIVLIALNLGFSLPLIVLIRMAQ